MQSGVRLNISLQRAPVSMTMKITALALLFRFESSPSIKIFCLIQSTLKDGYLLFSMSLTVNLLKGGRRLNSPI